MRTKLLLLASAAVLSFNASARDAAPARVDVVGQPKRVAMAPQVFQQVQGDYELEDGRILHVTARQSGKLRTLYADLGDGPVELVHVGQQRFAGLNTDVRLAFEEGKYASAVQVTGAPRF